ncbi:MAG TPA: DUF4082 domain-containing protein [Verrucomicrobiota bacterium]|nr:DUF4082 domain-containing protein [Verrucomicrobiota bacterium]
MPTFVNGLGGYANGTVGWTFQTTTTVSVTALGCFDYLLSPGQNTILVGLWAADGTLLASNAVTAASQVENYSRYEASGPVVLNPGQVYHIGASSATLPILFSAVSPEYGGYAVLSPEVQLLGWAASFGGFLFPVASPGTPGIAAAAPNFQYTLVQSQVPEPSSVVLLLLGGFLALAGRKNAA